MSDEVKKGEDKAIIEQQIAEQQIADQQIADKQEIAKRKEANDKYSAELLEAQNAAYRAKEIMNKQDKKKNNQYYDYGYDNQYYDNNQYYDYGYDNQYDNQYYNQRYYRRAGIVTKIVLFVLAAVIFFSSYIGIKSVEECNDKYDNDSDRELVDRSNFAYITSMGLSCGIVFYLLLNRFVGKFPIIFFGMTLLALGIIYVMSYEDLKKTSEECYKKSKYQFRISYGLIGAGAGVVFFSLLELILSKIARPLLTTRIIMVFMSIFCVGVGILNILVNNSCDDKSKGNKGTGKYKNISIGILAVSGFLLIATLVSFYFIRF